MKRKRKRKRKRSDFSTPAQEQKSREIQLRLAERIAEYERELGLEPDPTPMLIATKRGQEMTAQERAQFEQWDAKVMRMLEERVSRGRPG